MTAAPTTPPRPVDIEQVFPELAEHAATATRLHPRAGDPGVDDSSVGGPLRWPADEPWPMCTGHEHDLEGVSPPQDVRHRRRIYAAAQARADASGEPYTLTDAERVDLPERDEFERVDLAGESIALVPVAQLYRRDVAELPGPADVDLVQVLWCPLDHPDLDYQPRVEVRWRRVADLTGQLDAVPEPAVVYEEYLPTPCVVHPEPVREHRYVELLPDDLRQRLTAWEEESGHSYRSELSTVPGWKVGGFADWSLSDWEPVDCEECGTAMTLLLTADSGEREGAEDTWQATDGPGNPVDVVIGRGYALYIFVCPTDVEHPPATVMQ